MKTWRDLAPTPDMPIPAADRAVELLCAHDSTATAFKPYYRRRGLPAMTLSMATLPDRLQRRPRLSRDQRLDMIGMRARPEMLPRLARFIKFLAANGIVEFGRPLPAGEEGLVVVDRVEQCAFLALYHGHDMGFEFASFSRGPVSDEMADGIYRLSGGDSHVYGEPGPGMPASFRTAPFLDLVSGRSAKWMCAASTLLAINIDYRKDLEWIRGRVKDLVWHGRDAVDDAFDEIKRRGVFRLDQ